MSKSIGFIGAGNHAVWSLYPTLQYVPDVSLRCICDLDLEKAHAAAARFGAEQCYTNYAEMLDTESLDAVFCCGGPDLHADVIAACLDRRVPLFVEKPPARTAAELEPLARLARESDTPVMVAFIHRFAPITTWARSVMARPEFGRAMSIFAREGLWGMEAESLVMDSGIHHLDLMRFLCGEVEWVQAVRVSDGQKRHAVAVTMLFTGGMLGQLNLNSMESLTTPSDRIEIHGNQGGFICLDNWTRAEWIRDPGVLFSPPADPMQSSLRYEHGWTAAGVNRSARMQGYAGEIEHFFQCLDSGTKPSPDLDDGLAVLRLIEAIQQSVREDRRVPLAFPAGDSSARSL